MALDVIKEKWAFLTIALLVLIIVILSMWYAHEVASIKVAEIECKDTYIVPCEYECPVCECHNQNNDTFNYHWVLYNCSDELEGLCK